MHPRLPRLVGFLAAAHLLAQTPPPSAPAETPAGAPAQAAVAPAQAAPAPVPTPAAERSFDIETSRREIAPLLRELAKDTGMRLRVVGYLPLRLTISLKRVTFEQALDAICKQLDIAYKKLEDGSFAVGHHTDLLVEFASPTDTTEVDVNYRCRHLSAASLADVITKSFPSITAFTGPLFLSPTLESGSTSISDTVKALSATDQAFKTHDVLISGPVNLVKRALVLARKFDRNRKQVRIKAQLTELTNDANSDLGITWTLPSVALQEIPDATSTSLGIDKGVKGIKFGSFAHSAATIGAAIQAKEKVGKARTLANPSISLVDGERSFILIGERRLYPKQTGTNSQGLPTFDVAEVKTGVYLQVSVQVGLDNELVMTVYPQVSSVTSTETINNSQYPVISTREAQTTVQIRSGEMLAIGGLLKEEDNKSTTRVPLLGYIPVLGELFTFRHKLRSKSELLLLITPEIIDSEQESDSIRESDGK